MAGSYTSQGLPFASGSHESYQAAVKAASSRGAKTLAYLKLLAKRGPTTDPEASAALKLPRSSICSIRNGAIVCGLVEKGSTSAKGPYGVACRKWLITTAGKSAVQAMKAEAA